MYLPLSDESFSKGTPCHATVRPNTEHNNWVNTTMLESTLEPPWETHKTVAKYGKKSFLMPSKSRRIEMVLPGYQ